MPPSLPPKQPNTEGKERTDDRDRVIAGMEAWEHFFADNPKVDATMGWVKAAHKDGFDRAWKALFASS